MTLLNENEMSVDQTPTSHNSNAEVTDVNSSVPPTNDNCTIDKNNVQATNDNSTSSDVVTRIINSEFPVNDITPPSFRDNNKLDTYSLAKYMVGHNHIINLRGMLYIYVNGIYERNTQLIDKIIRNLARGAKPAELKAVYSDLLSIAPVMTESSYYYVAFNNCIVDIRTLDVIHYKDIEPYDYIITSKVYADYDVDLLEVGNPNLEFVKSFFDVISCNNPEMKQFLFEIIGYSMIRSAKYQLGFILKGYANNGKSDYLHIIENLLGKFCSHQNLSQLSKTKSLMALYGCTANIIDDTCEIKKLDFAQIQSIISGGTLSLDFNGVEEFAFAPYSTLLLATNHYLCFKGCHRELMRRFIVVPFSANLDDRADIDMTENICSQKHLNVIATLAIRIFNKVIVDKQFHIPELVASSTTTFFLQSNPVLEFIKSHPIQRLVSKGDYWADFYRWCHRHGIETSETNATFGAQVIAYGYEPKPHTIGGIKDTYYQVLGFNMQSLYDEYEAYKSSLDSNIELMSLSRYIYYLYEQDIIKTEV